MNIDCFMKQYADVLMNDKDDHVFEILKIVTGGTTSVRIAKLLNFAVSQMDRKETYIEVGVFAGTTLISAAYNNMKTCIGIDKYDVEEIRGMGADATEVRNRCLHNIKQSNCGARLIEKDFREVTKEDIAYPVAVSFIDGKHDFTDVTENLKWLVPMLADEAIIVFDDVNYMEVSNAIFTWLQEHPETWDLISYEKPFYRNENYMNSVRNRFLNNGVCVLHYHKDPQTTGFIIRNN